MKIRLWLVEETPLWGRIIAFYTYSPFLVWLYPLGLDVALKTYVIMAAFILDRREDSTPL